MKIHFSAKHLARYKQIAVLLWKYGRSDLANQMGLHDVVESDAAKPGTAGANPEQLANDLEAMGPTYVKLGQVLSSRPDLLPEAYSKALARLQDSVKPFSYDEVEQIIAAELGIRVSKAFSQFEPKPIAAASLGQVHSAALRDGRLVVVKIQRPGIRQQIAEDFEVLDQIADFLDAHTSLGKRYRFLRILEEFRISINNELNYEREAQNLVTVGRNLKQFELIQVPQPIPDYSTRSVLTMDYVQGRKITSVGPLVRMEMHGTELAGELLKGYLKQVLVDGVFHADPHPGNVFLTDDGRIALLDLGMVGHTTPAMQVNLLKLLLAITEGNSDVAGEVVIGMSQTTEDFDKSAFLRLIGQLLADQRDQGLKRIKVGQSLLNVTRSAADNGLFAPSELTLLGKTLLQLDEIGKILAPNFEPNAFIRENVSELMTQRLTRNTTQGTFINSFLEMKDFVSGLPTRLNKILDAFANNELQLTVRALDAKLMMEGLQKIANRITSGIVLAALIIGASLLMQVPTQFRIFGYPGLAMLCFLAAAAGGFGLVINIFIQDQQRRKK